MTSWACDKRCYQQQTLCLLRQEKEYAKWVRVVVLILERGVLWVIGEQVVRIVGLGIIKARRIRFNGVFFDEFGVLGKKWGLQPMWGYAVVGLYRYKSCLNAQ